MSTKIQNSNFTLRSSLRKLLSFPVKASQLTGSFIFSLDANAELSFSWLSYPIFIAGFKVILGVTAILIFYDHKEEYMVLFGNWTDTDLFTNLMMTMISFISDIFSTVMSYRNRNLIKKFHNQLLEFLEKIYGEIEKDYPSVCAENLRQLDRNRKCIKVCVILTIFVGSISFLGAITEILVVGFTIVHSKLISLVCAPLVMLFAIGLTIFRQTHYYIVAGVLSCISLALNLLNDQCKLNSSAGNPNKEAKLIQFLCDFKKVTDIIKDLNVTFQWMLITGVLTLFINSLGSIFQCFEWYSTIGSVTAVLSFGPQILSYTMALYFLCHIASDIYISVHIFN